MYTLAEIQNYCGGEIHNPGSAFPFSRIQHYAFDSRSISSPGDTLFIALQTAHRDGHAFIQEANRKGVRQFLVSRIPPGVQGNFLVVENPLKVLQQLAAIHRKQFKYPVIGITGSNGKTIVKEWITLLIGPETEMVRSPGSFNSSLGVPVSVLRMNETHELALFEAGISRRGEMQILEEIIQPDTLVLTHLGEAHADGFNSFEEKIGEKLLLGKRALSVLTWSSQRQWVQQAGLPVKTIGTESWNDIILENLQERANGWSFRIGICNFQLNQEGLASLENAALSILTALEYGVPLEIIQERISGFHPISMRMEMITDNPATTVLNDAFTADPDSVRNAFQALNRITAQPKKIVILTDLDHLGKATVQIQEQLMMEAINQFGKDQVILIGPIFQSLGKDRGIKAWANPQLMLENIPGNFFEHAAVLLKGARRFSLEQLVPILSGRVSATYFRIDLSALVSNYRILKSQLNPEIKIMAMVKASAYGSGSWEIARELESEGVNYLAVAYITEGIALREKGILTPIMVMNPDPEGLSHLNTYQLEPVAYSISFLESLLKQSGKGNPIKVHIEIESGMMRLGFPADEVVKLCDWLHQNPEVLVASVFTHLAAADIQEEDSFTRQQFEVLRHSAEEIKQVRNGFWVHAQNTAAAIRFKNIAGLNMVRLGIGLYGLPPIENGLAGLKETGSLISRISQIHICPAGATIGYNRSLRAEKDMKVATIPLGYADGIPRCLSNGKASFYVKGQAAPIAGTICMDMIMLDVSHIAGVKSGDEVLIFGYQNNSYQSVQVLAEAAETIPYEIITGIHPRVRRVYVRE